MLQTLRKNWLLLAMCGVLEVCISAIYFVLHDTQGPVTFHAWHGTIVFAGKLALVAAACAFAAGIWRSATGRCWPLALNGLALAALGLIQYGLTGYRIRFLVVALLIILMTVSVGILDFSIARALRRRHRVVDGWVAALAGVISAGFAIAFLALGFQWIKVAPGSHRDLLWLSSYFGFSALNLLGLALGFRSQDVSPAGRREALPPLGNPTHAH